MRFFSLTLLFVLGACTTASSPSEEGELILRTYTVPNGMAESIGSIMNQNFILQEEEGHRRVAKVSVLPNGQVAVLGSAGIHQGFAQLVKDLADHRPAPVDNAIVDLWVVISVKTEGDQRNDSLQPISAALAEIERHSGEMGFRLLEKLRVVGAPGDRAMVRGSLLSANLEIGKRMDQFSLDLIVEMMRGSQQLHTRLNTAPGKTIVIGESSITAGTLDRLGIEDLLTEQTSFYYIVQLKSV